MTKTMKGLSDRSPDQLRGMTLEELAGLTLDDVTMLRERVALREQANQATEEMRGCSIDELIELLERRPEAVNQVSMYAGSDDNIYVRVRLALTVGDECGDDHLFMLDDCKGCAPKLGSWLRQVRDDAVGEEESFGF